MERLKSTEFQVALDSFCSTCSVRFIGKKSAQEMHSESDYDNICQLLQNDARLSRTEHKHPHRDNHGCKKNTSHQCVSDWKCPVHKTVWHTQYYGSEDDGDQDGSHWAGGINLVNLECVYDDPSEGNEYGYDR